MGNFLTNWLMLLSSFNGVPAEERLHWRSFLVKLGADNLKGIKNEELLVACHKYVYSFLLTPNQFLCKIKFLNVSPQFSSIFFYFFFGKRYDSVFNNE